MEATLSKWGNSQGILIPKALCNALGLKIGDKLELEEDEGVVTLRPKEKRFMRTEKKSASELFGSYAEAYEAPRDWARSGNEADWGKSVGVELAW